MIPWIALIAEPSEAAALEKIAHRPPQRSVSQHRDVLQEDVGPHDAEPEGNQHRLPARRQQESHDGHVIAAAAEAEQVRLPAKGVRVKTQGDVDEAAVDDAFGDRQLIVGQAE